MLSESALHLESFVLPKVEPVKQHLDLAHRGLTPRVAEFVGSTSEDDNAQTAGDEAANNHSSSFLKNVPG